MVKQTLQNILKRKLKKQTIVLYDDALYFVKNNALILISKYKQNKIYVMSLECAERILLHLNIPPTKYSNAYYIAQKAFINRIFPISNIKHIALENILYPIRGVPDICLTYFGYNTLHTTHSSCRAYNSLRVLADIKDNYVISPENPSVIPKEQVHLCRFIVDYHLSYFCQDLRRIIIQYSEYDIHYSMYL